MINHLIMTQSNPPYRFLRSLDCPFKFLVLCLDQSLCGGRILKVLYFFLMLP